MHKLKHTYTHSEHGITHEKWLKINSMSFFLLYFHSSAHPTAHHLESKNKGGKFFNLLILKKKTTTKIEFISKEGTQNKKIYNNRNDTHYTH